MRAKLSNVIDLFKQYTYYIDTSLNLRKSLTLLRTLYYALHLNIFCITNIPGQYYAIINRWKRARSKLLVRKEVMVFCFTIPSLLAGICMFLKCHYTTADHHLFACFANAIVRLITLRYKITINYL